MGLCGTGIVWNQFSWEAFATLVTGLAAVCAAYRLGKKQIAIQEAQIRIQEQSLKADIFERRFQVYGRVRNFITDLVQHGNPQFIEFENDLLLAELESKFLFTAHTTNGINKIWKNFNQWKVLKNEQDSSQSELDSFNWFGEKLKTLPELFPELNIGCKF